MKKTLILHLLLFVCVFTYAQNKHFTLGINDSGLCFGNSENTNGVRFNFLDKNVRTVNGLNVTLLKEDGRNNGISLALISLESTTSNGIFANGIFGYSSNINGIGMGLMGCSAENFNGIGVGGLAITGENLNGVFTSIFGVSYWGSERIKRINGIAAGLIIGANTNSLNGVAIGAQNNIGKQNGISIGIANKAEELHGFQFGLWNVAKNKKYLKGMPFINFCFRKKDKKK